MSLSELSSDGDSLYWLESRPADSGRVVLVRHGPHGRHDHSPGTVSIRSRVHEYGGGAVCLVPGSSAGTFAYVDQDGQDVWLCDGAAAPVPLNGTAPPGEERRHGGLSATSDGAWVLAVRETHRDGAPRPERSVVALSTRGAPPHEVTLLGNHAFFGAPRVDAGAERLAVVTWERPHMPWDASTLLVVPLERRGGELAASGPPWVVAGGDDESVGQPHWASDGTLRFVSDRRGWWQPYVHAGLPDTPPRAAVALTDVAAEWHGPDWVLGMTTVVELADGTTVARMTASGCDTVVALPPKDAGGDGTPVPLGLPCVSVASVCAHGDGIAVIGSTPVAPPGVWVWTPAGGARPLHEPGAGMLVPDDVADGEPFTVEGRSGRPVHGTLYRPTAALRPSPGRHGTAAPPPLLVWCHSGPTSAWQAGLDLSVQYFTSRGFAVAGVDYAGSTGYGREYRCALWGQWGVADSEDCLDAARHLVAQGEADAARLAVRGSSAGGMTALNALAAGEGFTACVSWYGVTDLQDLVATTHDFEAHSCDLLVGPFPRTRRRYEERSPVRRAGKMRGAVLLLQGTEDPVVPPEQAERMRAALLAVGRRCDLRFFEGEGHGFRRADTVVAALEAEWAFYLEVLEL